MVKLFICFKIQQPGDHIDFYHRYDCDGNGFVDFKEFMTTLSVASRGTPDEKLIWAFKLYDKDNNGYLLEKDVADILTVSNQCTELLIINYG